MCIHMDTVCELQQDFAEYIETIQIEEKIKNNTFSLGVVNGKEYFFTEINGQYIISIVTPKQPALTQVF